MPGPVLPILRRHRRLLAPLLAAIAAGAVVAGVSLATDGTQTPITALKPGEKVRVVVRHQNGTNTTLSVTLGTYPGG